KALINILPLDQGESITTIMPLPEDEATWDKLDVMFATTRGTVRRNKLSDFADVRRSGIIAMKLDEGDKLISLSILRHVEASADERAAYLKRASAVRRGNNGDSEENNIDGEEATGAIELGEMRYVVMS